MDRASVNKTPCAKQCIINVLSLNVCGIKSKLLIQEFIDFLQSYDVVCLCETRCDDVDMSIVGETMENLGFVVVFKNRHEVSRYKSGGLVIAIKKNAPFKWKQIKHTYETLLSIRLDHIYLNLENDLIITAVYIPPSNSRYANKDHFDELDNLLLNYTNTDYFHLLCGDYNAHTGTMTDIIQVNDDDNNYFVNDDVYNNLNILSIPEPRFNQDATLDRSSYGKKLLEICKCNQVIILNGRMGHDRGVGKVTTSYNTTVDYVIGSPLLMKYVTHFEVLQYEPLYSDVHCGIRTQMTFSSTESNVIYEVNGNQAEGFAIAKPGKWSQDKESEYESRIDIHRIEQIVERLDMMGIDEICEELKDTLVNPAINVFPVQRKRQYVKITNGVCMKGFNGQTLKCRKQYHKARHKYNKRRSTANFTNMTKASKSYKMSLKQAKNKENVNLITRLRKNRDRNPKSYWKILKGYKKNLKIPIALDEFYEHFKLLADEDNDINSDENIPYEVNINDNNSILNDPITVEEVKKCIRTLKNNKSPGNDMILNEYIKCTQNVMLPLYVKLFNKILNTGHFPKEWLTGVIIPLYKNKGDIKDVNNYRGITLLSCVGKLFTSVLNERLKHFSDVTQAIGESQAGFRSDYSTLDHIFLLKCVIDIFNWKKEKLYCLFVDYKKAFDLVWREGLWYKLVKEKVDGKILNVIRSMYNNIKSCVMLEQQKSNTFICNMGVRQGENLSPLLFAFFVNDIESELIKHNCSYLNFKEDLLNNYLQLLVLMYADDTIILSDSEHGMKQALIALNSYCNDWKLKINCNKTKIVVFSRGKVQTDKYNFTFGCEKIEVVDHYKYLGVTFNYNGRFRKGELELKDQAKRAMYSILGTCRKHDLPVDIQIEMYNSMVLSIMTYASEIWGHYVIRELELLQMKFLKQVLCVHKKTSTDIVYGELGLFPLEITIKCRMIGYWVRILTGKQSKLSYIMYNCLLQLDQSGVYSSPWIAYIKGICNDCGMSGVWLSQNITNPIWFKKAIEMRLKDQWITVWNGNMSNKSVCSSYKMYKEVYGIEEYLLKLKKSNRILVSKLRASNNKLPIIVGRFQEIAREDRVCDKCEANVVGDEYHVLFVCQNENIAGWRNMYIPHFYRRRPNHLKFKLLMQTSNVNILNNLALFLRKIYSIFR